MHSPHGIIFFGFIHELTQISRIFHGCYHGGQPSRLSLFVFRDKVFYQKGDNPVALVRSFLHKSYKTPWLRERILPFSPASCLIFRKGPPSLAEHGPPDSAGRVAFAFSPKDSSGPCVFPAKSPHSPDQS